MTKFIYGYSMPKLLRIYFTDKMVIAFVEMPFNSTLIREDTGLLTRKRFPTNYEIFLRGSNKPDVLKIRFLPRSTV